MKTYQLFLFFIIILPFHNLQGQDKTQTIMDEKKKIGICLSGGGALGYAHIGALQALEEHGIKPNHVAGCSMGGIMGVFYAAGYTPAEILQIIENEKAYKFKNLFHLEFTNTTGLIKHTKLRKMLDKYIVYNSFDSLQMPFAICCTDIQNGVAAIFSKGAHLKDYVVASASIPCIFESVDIDGVEYVDGGVINNFPVEALIEAKCDIIIGINVVNFTPYNTKMDKISLLPRIFSLVIGNLNTERYAQCNYSIPIKNLNTIETHAFSFKKWQYIYRCGYESVNAYIVEHPEILHLCQ